MENKFNREYPKIIDEIYKDNPKAKEVLLTHSFCVADEALKINKEMNLNLDEKFLYEAAMLHDIGIIGINAPGIYCYGEKPYQFHGVLGAEMLKGTEYEKYERICSTHLGVGLTKDDVIKLGIGTEEMMPKTLEEKLIIYVDCFYSKSTLGSKKPLQNIIESLKKTGDEKVDKFFEYRKLFCKEDKEGEVKNV